MRFHEILSAQMTVVLEQRVKRTHQLKKVKITENVDPKL